MPSTTSCEFADVVLIPFSFTGQLSSSLARVAVGVYRSDNGNERALADQEGLLQVYVVELSSVTLAAPRGLASAFRNRAGNYALVLTHDYERIDFVLVEKIAPRPEHAKTIGQKQISVRPRILTVDRRNPSKVALRVFRRLSYTEPDPIAQYDKLKSAFDVAYWSAEHFNNRALFADYYLSERLPDDPEWKEDAKPIFLKLRALYDRAATRWAGKSDKESRAGPLEPVFHALGFPDGDSEVGGRRQARPPDYRLRADDGTLVAVCLAYRWGRFLDGGCAGHANGAAPSCFHPRALEW